MPTNPPAPFCTVLRTTDIKLCDNAGLGSHGVDAVGNAVTLRQAEPTDHHRIEEPDHHPTRQGHRAGNLSVYREGGGRQICDQPPRLGGRDKAESERTFTKIPRLSRNRLLEKRSAAETGECPSRVPCSARAGPTRTPFVTQSRKTRARTVVYVDTENIFRGGCGHCPPSFFWSWTRKTGQSKIRTPPPLFSLQNHAVQRTECARMPGNKMVFRETLTLCSVVNITWAAVKRPEPAGKLDMEIDGVSSGATAQEPFFVRSPHQQRTGPSKWRTSVPRHRTTRALRR